MNTNSENATNGPPWIPIPGYETGYPHPSRKIGQAWAAVWSELQGATDWVDGVDLANRTATEVGPPPPACWSAHWSRWTPSAARVSGPTTKSRAPSAPNTRAPVARTSRVQRAASLEAWPDPWSIW
jgi:hypothetical protein